MDPKLLSVKTTSASSALTVAHLIRNIEQLKNKDKLISQLEKDLGRHNRVSAAPYPFAVLQRRRSEGNPLNPDTGLADQLVPGLCRTLPEGCDDPDSFPWSTASIQTPGDVEVGWISNVEGNPLGKYNGLPSKLKCTKDPNQELVEKCRSFIQQNKELTAQNMAFKERSERANEESKNAQQVLEQSKLQLFHLSRQLGELQEDRDDWESQLRSMDGLRQELMEDKKMINALRKACSDKDRRIELMQHRKIRRRMIESAEKVKIQKAGLKETPFGYEADDQQQLVDGNQSVCSFSSTISDDSVWDDIMTKEEMERNYQRLMLEQLELQKSHALLQTQCGNLQDPQRENQSKSELQNDLFLSQCRVEQLEHYIREGLQGKSEELWEEREKMQSRNKTMQSKVKSLTEEIKKLENELSVCRERNEDMEFRLMELEQCNEELDTKDEQCQASEQTPCVAYATRPAVSTTANAYPYQLIHTGNTEEVAHYTQVYLLQVMETGQMMEGLAKELNALLKGKGRDADLALKKLECYIDKEKALENMAHEMQIKVISLQQEKHALQDRLLLVEQSQPGTGTSSYLTQAKERQENLALKSDIEKQNKFSTEDQFIQDKLNDLKSQKEELLDYCTTGSPSHYSSLPVVEDLVQSSTQTHLSETTPFLNLHQNGNVSLSQNFPLRRKYSGRKSKCRDGNDPVTTKKRKSVRENEFSRVESALDSGHATHVFQSVMSENDQYEQIGTLLESDVNSFENRKCHLEKELSNIKTYNDELVHQMQESRDKILELDSRNQCLQEQILSMEQRLDLLHRENVALGEQLRQRVDEFQITQDERNPRISELEEFCEDLQDRLKDAENCERQLREKLKVYEKSIEEAEIQEMAMRERCEQLLTGDFEAKKQIQDLHRTGLELRDILIEKEIVEQALRDKVDFLQKAEAASVHRIEELEAIVEDLRHQLHEKANGQEADQNVASKMTEMKTRMTFLETDNSALSARVAELEENEEILRENWRRVAEEDYKRTQNLEEKVKMLDSSNRDLKTKLKDAQEMLVIDMSKANLSLAAELAESDAKLFEDSSDDDEGSGMESMDSPSKHSTDSENKGMREKVRTLERQLSEVAEKKNTKIESLQEQLVHFKETEIKLSETISEMEMTERELRAKLALYESSEITVEKMLKYQTKIQELRTSQESLLDQLELKESEGMTLQEKMQENERTLRGNIVSLEVEMKGFKQRELKTAGIVRELEKQESELSAKVAQQAEKENGLYVKISALMDELKATKTELDMVTKQMEDKEDKVRQAKLLEVKLLETEMESAKKVSTLDAKLRHREEEFRQKECAYEEQISLLQHLQQHQSKQEDEVAKKGELVKEKEEQISSLFSQISELEENSKSMESKVVALQSELEKERTIVNEKEIMVQYLKEEIDSKSQSLELMNHEKDEIKLGKETISGLEKELLTAHKYIEGIEREKEIVKHDAYLMMCDLKSVCDKCIFETEDKMTNKLALLEAKYECTEALICDLQIFISDKSMKICELHQEIAEQKEMYEECILKVENERVVLENEYKEKLDQETSKLSSQQAILLKESQEREASLSFDVSNLQLQVDQHKRELISKLSELETKNKVNCEQSLELSNLRHEHKIIQKDLDNMKQSYTDLKSSMKSIVNEKDYELNESHKDNSKLSKELEVLKSQAGDKDRVIEQIINDKDKEIKYVCEEKSKFELQFIEKCTELDNINKLQLDSQAELVSVRKILSEKDHAIQRHEQEKGEKETQLKETDHHIQNARLDKESLSQELQSVRTKLDLANNQISQQQEALEALHNQLHSHQNDIKNFESILKQKEELLQEKDQTYQQTSTELKKLKDQLEERDHKLEQADCKVADVELKLQKAENRVRELEAKHVSLEMRLEERYAVSQNAEKVLEAKKIECDEMKTKLDVSENNLANLKDQLSVGDVSFKEIVEKLEMKDNDLEVKSTELVALQKRIDEKEAVNLSLENKYQQLENGLRLKDEKLTEDKENFKKQISEKEKQILVLKTSLSKGGSTVNELKQELDQIKELLREKETCCDECEQKVNALQANELVLKSNCDNLESKLETVNRQIDQNGFEIEKLKENIQEKDTLLGAYESQSNKNSEEHSVLHIKLESSEKMLSAKLSEVESVTEENQSLKNTIEELLIEKNSAANEMQSSEDKNKSLVSQLESDNLDLTSVNEILRKQSLNLQDRLDKIEQDMVDKEKHCNSLSEKNESLVKQIYDHERDNDKLQTQIESFQHDVKSITAQKEKLANDVNSLEAEKTQLVDANLHLQKEIEDAANEFQSLTTSFEDSRGDIQDKMQEMCTEKELMEGKLEVLQKEHQNQAEELNVKQREIDELKHKCDEFQNSNVSLLSEVNSLKCESVASKGKENVSKSIVEEPMIFESMVSVNAAPSLNAAPPKVSLGKEHNKKELENSLKEKGKLSEMRISELETVEKELREQIVDIEKTVIIPLENENQDLKDEIGIVKQERDEAINKISKWDEDDNGSEERVQQSEELHQRLEDALIFGEELEKKNDILLKDIQRLENENAVLSVNVSELETSEAEKKDEVDNLQEEIRVLNETQEHADVMEETETTLMDKVLDLEERERILIQQLDTVKHNISSYSDIEDVVEKMKYLQQKTQILEDAQGRFMDKIMELEEDKHRLLSKFSSFSEHDDNTYSTEAHSSQALPSNKTITSTSTQTSLMLSPTNSDDNHSVADSSHSADSVYHSDSSHSNDSSRLHNKYSDLESRLLESTTKLSQFDSQLREKETMVLYLQDKLELLQESECKLMDRLLEAEEKGSSVVHAKYATQINDLNHKIEQLQEENEFLAENVEQYKKSFKEEKERCNTLQDKLMDDTASLGELERTQQMVEDMQTEYEEQLCEHREQENSLRGKVSNLVLRVEELEHLVNAKTTNEELLQKQVEDLKALRHDESLRKEQVLTPSVMLEKPEDVLNQRIKELEGLDKHNKNTVSELERDREVLHEIARKDKTTIHDLKVTIRELQLSQRSLKEQVSSLEVSENSYFTKCEELDAVKAQLEDRVHELEIHERRLRELVRKLKLDEERWLSKSGGMENAVAELSANETQLKCLVQDLQLEQGGMTEKCEYLDGRIRELESVECNLLSRIKEYENREIMLENKLVQLENAVAAAKSRATELDLLNTSLSQQHKKMIDENAIMAQHLAQLHGQVQDLDRRLMSSVDSEMAYKQHVESLQKNESLLQKKVREFELREIDSQSAIRELEQTMELNKDKLSALQRSENRLKYRLQVVEGDRGHIPGELTPSQQENLPQTLEDCQKRVVVLENQVDSLKTQLRQTLATQSKSQPDVKSKDSESESEREKDTVEIDREEYSQLHVKVALLDEYAYQNGELEANTQHLKDTILQLRQGKDACGHEVEIEVYKRRLESLCTMLNKLKSSLSQGQTTSLMAPEPGSDAHGDTLPARILQGLESERVLQSVRGLPANGKADFKSANHIQSQEGVGLNPVDETMVQAQVVRKTASMPQELLGDRKEESHWKAIEARKPVTSVSNDSRGGIGGTVDSHNGRPSSSMSGETEEVIGVLNLHSESELSSYHRMTQNESDSCSSPVPPPRKNRGKRTSRTQYTSDDNSSKNGSGSERELTPREDMCSPQRPHRHSSHAKITLATAKNQKHFDNGLYNNRNTENEVEKSLPLTATNRMPVEEKFTSTKQTKTSTPAPLSRFADDSFYLPSSTQEGVDSLDDECSPPPLPSNGPPGHDYHIQSGSTLSQDSFVSVNGEERKESLDNSANGLSIRERIALIERHLQSDTHTSSRTNREEDDQMFYWKRKSTENLRQVETLDKSNKFLKDDINRLEKELEEKRRYINTLELWLSSTEDLLKNKIKQTDREMVEQLQLDLVKLRRELSQSGYRSEDALLDPAALKTEVEHKDREINIKRQEIEALAEELRRCHKECNDTEGMRRTALDSLRSLEKHVIYLQDTEEKLNKSQAEINSMKVQYDELEQFKNEALAMVQPLQLKVERLTKQCKEKEDLIRRLESDMRRGLTKPSSALEELKRRERALNGDGYHTDNSSSVSDDISPRPTQSRMRARSASMDKLSVHQNTQLNGTPYVTQHLNHSFSDTESLHHPSSFLINPLHPSSHKHRQRPTPYVNSRPRSADTGAMNGASPASRRSLDASHSTHQSMTPGVQRFDQYHPASGRGFDLPSKHFVAIADYDPGLYSQSGTPDYELALREGDLVRVTGAMDRRGYCEAESNGRHGLVPANYLQPAYHGGDAIPTSSTRGNQQAAVIPVDRHLTSPTPFHGDGGPPQHNGYGSGPLPDPPSRLHVRVEDGCLVLAWHPPTVDSNDCNRGLQVKGYIVYVDQQVYQQVNGPKHCHLLIQGFDPSTPHHLAVQTLCTRGHKSVRAELLCEGVVRLGEESNALDNGLLDTDLSSVLDSVQYTKGKKKKVMALYSYNPEQHTPHDYPTFELAFSAGDVISVYGQPRTDGFYHGEVSGKRGLVPACFVEDLPARHGKQGSEDSGLESSKA